MVLHAQLSIIFRKVKYPLCFVVSYVYLLTSIMNQELFESTSAIKVATMKIMDDFHYEGKRSHASTKLTLFAVNKVEWDTKEDTGKSTNNTLYVLRYA